MKALKLEKNIELLSDKIEATAIKIAYDGARVFCAKSVGSAVVYDLEQKIEIKRIKNKGEQFYLSLDVTRTGLFFAYAYQRIYVVDTSDWKKQYILKGNSQQTRVIQFSADEKFLAVAGGKDERPKDFVIKIFDLSIGGQRLRLRGHKTIIGDATFDVNREEIYTLDTDCVCKIWHSGTGTELNSVQLDLEVLYRINPNLKGAQRINAKHLKVYPKSYLATATINEEGMSYHNIVLLFDIRNGMLLHEYRLNKLSSISQLRYYSGKLWIAGNEGFEIWEVGTEEFQYIDSFEVNVFDIASNGRFLVFSSQEKLYKIEL